MFDDTRIQCEHGEENCRECETVTCDECGEEYFENTECIRCDAPKCRSCGHPENEENPYCNEH